MLLQCTLPAKRKCILLICAFLLLFSSADARDAKKPSPLSGKLIVIDPGHGGTAKTDSYRQGPTGEREEWIDLRVALMLKDMLEAKGARVLLARSNDTNVPLMDRPKLAVDNKADFFVSIHHNATADPSVNFPIIYYHGLASENQAGVAFAKILAKNLTKHMYKSNTPVSIVSDYTIFSSAGAGVLRGSYGIPGVLAEASFFTNPGEESRLKQEQHNKDEALAYVLAIETFFSKPTSPILTKNTADFPPQFKTLQEAERMSPIARRWKQDYEEAKSLMKKSDPDSLKKAYDLFTQSAKAFPDSYVAGECHKFRARLLKKMGQTEEAANEEKRVREFYPAL